MPLYRRILLKVSGEAFGDSEGRGVDLEAAHSLGSEIKAVHDLGVDLAVVVGGGNLWRGGQASTSWMDRATADYMGMLGTSMNGLGLTAALENHGLVARHLTAIQMPPMGELFLRRRALRHLEKRRVLVMSGGTGSPFFTTDTAAALRGAELGVEAVFKATKVDGIFTADPQKDPSAQVLSSVTYQEVLERRLGVMDAAAISLCRENHIPIHVFNLFDHGTLERILKGEKVGSVVREEAEK